MKMPQPPADGDNPDPSLLLHGKPKPAWGVAGSRPTCEACQTDEFLVFEKIVPVRSPGSSGFTMWDLDYWCGNCESYYGFQFQTPVPGTDRHIP